MQRSSKRFRDNEDKIQEDDAEDTLNEVSPAKSSGGRRGKRLGLQSRFPIQQAVECMVLSLSIAATNDDPSAGDRFRRQANESVSQYLRQVLEGFRRQMNTGVPELRIPVLDPLQIVDFNLDEGILKGGITVIRASFSEVNIKGLSQFIIRHLLVNLETLRLDLTLIVPNLHVEGVYELDGKAVGFVPLSGHGPFWVAALELVATGYASLRINSEDHLDLQKLNIDLNVDKIGLNFDNLLGGGTIGEVANNVASALSKGTFDRIKPRIVANLESSLRNKLNDELRHFDAIGLIYGGLHCPMGMKERIFNANVYMDQVLEKARDQMKLNGLDPLSLPDTDVFTDGQLLGLSTIYRSGDGDLQFSPQAVALEAHLGFDDLKAYYKWKKRVVMHLSGHVGARVRDVSIFIRIRQPTTPGANPVMEDFEIEQLGRISVDLSGLGPVSWVLKKVVSAVSNLMRRRIAERLQGPVRQIIEDNLHSVSLPFG
ncbi:hypothetical protein CHUAL_010459 [Chamberlinius hualienensis]